jgi:hypothetical protein
MCVDFCIKFVQECDPFDPCTCFYTWIVHVWTRMVLSCPLAAKYAQHIHTYLFFHMGTILEILRLSCMRTYTSIHAQARRIHAATCKYMATGRDIRACGLCIRVHAMLFRYSVFRACVCSIVNFMGMWCVCLCMSTHLSVLCGGRLV